MFSTFLLFYTYLLQSIQYNDCDYEALTGQYKRELGMRPGEHIHPVIAALFFPKIDFLEQTFLHSNMAGIVKSRYNDDKCKKTLWQNTFVRCAYLESVKSWFTVQSRATDPY